MNALFCLDADEVDLWDLSSGDGNSRGGQEYWLQHSEGADLHLLSEGGEAGGVRRHATPAAPHAGQTDVGRADLPAHRALRAGSI